MPSTFRSSETCTVEVAANPLRWLISEVWVSGAAKYSLISASCAILMLLMIVLWTPLPTRTRQSLLARSYSVNKLVLRSTNSKVYTASWPFVFDFVQGDGKVRLISLESSKGLNPPGRRC